MRYINPGFKNWLTIGWSNAITEANDISKSKTGVSFKNTDSRNYIPIVYPANGEIYCKFDFYYMAGSIFNLQIGDFSTEGSNPYNGFAYKSSNSNQYAYIANDWSYVEKPVSNWQDIFKRGKVNSAVFHLKYSDSEKGFMTLQINDFILSSGESEKLVPVSNTIKFSFYSSDEISNVIISDEEISIKEQIVALPITSINSDMTFDSETGIYTASAANQSLLASVDVADLINNFGGDSKVTGIAMVGNPAYRTAEGLSSLTSISKKNNTVTEYGSVNVPADSNSVVAHSFKISDTVIADLLSMQLGWKVGG